MADGVLTAQTPDGMVLEGPIRRGALYVLQMTDPLTGEVAEKVFKTRSLHDDHFTQLVIGDRGDFTGPASSSRLLRRTAPGFRDATPAPQLSPHRALDRPNGGSSKFNIRAVREVLEQYGLDPTEELARVLLERRPVKGADGKPLMQPDPDTGELVPVTEPLLPTRDRAQVLLELQQYVTPKLRAVEMKAEIKTPLTDSAIDARIQQILDQHPQLASVVQAAR